MAIWRVEHPCSSLVTSEYFVEENGRAVVPFSSCSRINPPLSRIALIHVLQKEKIPCHQQHDGRHNGMLLVKTISRLRPAKSLHFTGCCGIGSHWAGFFCSADEKNQRASVVVTMVEAVWVQASTSHHMKRLLLY